MCCDDFVVRFQRDPHNYAAALLSLEKMRVGNSARLALAATGSKDQLLSRVKRILNVKSQNLNYGQKLLALLVVAGFISSVAWLSPVQPNRQSLSHDEQLARSVNQLLWDTITQNKIFLVKQPNKKDSIINLSKNTKKIQYQSDLMYMKRGQQGDTVIFDGDVNWNVLPERIPVPLGESSLLIAPSLSPDRSLTQEFNDAHKSPHFYFQEPPTGEFSVTPQAGQKLQLALEDLLSSQEENFQLDFEHTELSKAQQDLAKLEKELNTEIWMKSDEAAKSAAQVFEWKKMQEAARQEMARVWKVVEESNKKQKDANDYQFLYNYLFHLNDFAGSWSGDLSKTRIDSAIRKMIRRAPGAAPKSRTTTRRIRNSWQQSPTIEWKTNSERVEQTKRKQSTTEQKEEVSAVAVGTVPFIFEDHKGSSFAHVEEPRNSFSKVQGTPRIKVDGIASMKKVTLKSKPKNKTVIHIITDKNSYDIELR